MSRKRARPSSVSSLTVEALEGRIVQSSLGAALPQGAAQVMEGPLKKVPTTTTLSIGTGTLGQPITFNASVKVPASGGHPAGTVIVTDHGKLIETLTILPSGQAGPVSSASVTLAQPPGGSAYFFGKHSLTATFYPAGSNMAKSSVTKSFAVAQPSYTSLAGGVKVATIAQGSGPAIQAGQTANVLYTGYLAKTGQVFDDSANDGGSTLGFKVGAGAVIPGFDAGTVGMQAGETRIIEIPPSQGYGATANGPIPANSMLLFVVTLESIS